MITIISSQIAKLSNCQVNRESVKHIVLDCPDFMAKEIIVRRMMRKSWSLLSNYYLSCELGKKLKKGNFRWSIFFLGPSQVKHVQSVMLGRRNYHYLMAGLVLDEQWDSQVIIIIIIKIFLLLLIIKIIIMRGRLPSMGQLTWQACELSNMAPNWQEMSFPGIVSTMIMNIFFCCCKFRPLGGIREKWYYKQVK